MAETLQYGSQGDLVKELQETLNKKGFSLAVDGIFGAATQKAVKDYQKRVGLKLDGIVGQRTWDALLDGTGSPTAAPTLKPLPTQPTYDTTSWDTTGKGQIALGQYNTAKENLDKHGDFKYGNQQQLDNIINRILNREKFTYDLNGDALYQQYKDRYTQQAKMAMGDAIGQASAMTGGYGNSYAQSVGQQMYQKEMQGLNDIVPELYQMALDKYNMEGQELNNQYGMLSDDYNREYGKYTDKYGRLMDAVNISRGDYYDGANMHYTEQSNKNTVAGKEFDDAMSIWNSETDNAWEKAKWDESLRQRLEDLAYQKERDRIEDMHWQKEYQAMVKKNSSSGNTTGVKDKGGEVKDKDENDNPPKEDYSDWDASDWQSYFAQIRNSESKSAAEEELNRMIKAGIIPKNMLSYASIGARGKLGH